MPAIDKRGALSQWKAPSSISMGACLPSPHVTSKSLPQAATGAVVSAVALVGAVKLV